jgi:hypothetical protein
MRGLSAFAGSENSMVGSRVQPCESRIEQMPRTLIIQILGAFALLVALVVIWQASGAFFRWASAPHAEHPDSHE